MLTIVANSIWPSSTLPWASSIAVRIYTYFHWHADLMVHRSTQNSMAMTSPMSCLRSSFPPLIAILTHPSTFSKICSKMTYVYAHPLHLTHPSPGSRSALLRLRVLMAPVGGKTQLSTSTRTPSLQAASTRHARGILTAAQCAPSANARARRLTCQT